MKNLQTLTPKLKRHKIQFFYNENLNQIEIGKSLNKYKRILWATVLLSLGIVLFIYSIHLFASSGRGGISIKKFLLAIPIGLIYLGGMEIYKYIKLTRNSKRKIISPNSIIIQEGEEKTIPKDEIVKLDYFFDGHDSGESAGILYILTKDSNEKIFLLTLYDKDHTYLKDDLIFLKNTLKEYMNL